MASLFMLLVALPGAALAQEVSKAPTPSPSPTGVKTVEPPAPEPTVEAPVEEPVEVPVEEPVEDTTVKATVEDEEVVDEADTATDKATDRAAAQEAAIPSKGFIQVEGQDLDDTPQNAPHQGCIWTIEFRNFDASLGGTEATATLTLVSPTSLPGQEFSISGSTTLSGNDEAGAELDGTIVLDITSILQAYLEAGGEPHKGDQFHVRLDAVVAGEIEKHHVFWNLGCLPVVEPVPGIAITKSCPQAAEPGDQITYDITITNTGEEDLDIESVQDSLLGDITAEFPDILAEGDSVTVSLPFTIPDDATGTIENVVTVEAVGVESQDAVSDTANCVVTITPPPVPGIEITKSCPQDAEAGEEIVYDITITNTGEEALDIESVQDSLLGDITAEFPDILAEGDSVTVSLPFTIPDDATGTIENVVTVEAVGVDSQDAVTDTANCVVTITPPVPGIDITKSCPEEAVVGEIVTYEITITNTGEEALNIDAVNDTLLGDITDEFPAVLGIGQDATAVLEFDTSGQPTGPLTNVVTVDATGDVSGEAVTDTAECVVTINPPPVTGVAITKSCPEVAVVGDVITYQITVQNIGETELDITSVQDSLVGDITNLFPDTLAAGDQATAEVEFDTAGQDPGTLENVVTVDAVGVETGEAVSDSDDCLVTIEPPLAPEIAVLKSCPRVVTVGDTVIYTITIQNVGNEDLANVTVEDSLLGDLSDLFPDDLAIGESATVSVGRQTGTDDPNPLENVVTASAVGAESGTATFDVANCLTGLRLPPLPRQPTKDGPGDKPPAPPLPPEEGGIIPPAAAPPPSLAVTGGDISLWLRVLMFLALSGLGLNLIEGKSQPDPEVTAVTAAGDAVPLSGLLSLAGNVDGEGAIEITPRHAALGLGVILALSGASMAARRRLA